jgi:hypothetical protein
MHRTRRVRQAAEKETSEKVHTILDASKAEAKARQDEFKANVAKKAASASRLGKSSGRP